MTDESPQKRIQTTATVFDIIDALQAAGGLRVTELATALDIARSTAHAHLATLEERELVVCESGRYRPSLRFLELGMAVKHSTELPGVAKPIIDQLAVDTGLSVWLVVEQHGWAVYLDNAMGENAFRIESTVGEHAHLHCLAAGKALLAHLPAERIEAIIDRRGLPARTANTVTDRERFRTELGAIRDRGYAFNDEEDIDGVRGVGAPICKEDVAVGAVGVGGPANRLRGEYFRTDLPNQLLGATNEIELQLLYS